MSPDLKIRQSPAKILNQQTFIDYYQRLRLLALSMFEWQGLPDSVNQRFLEQTLFERGHALFFRDPAMSYMALAVTPAGQLNVYGEPVRYQAYGIGYTAQYGADECVLIRNNYDVVPTDHTLRLFAQRLAEVERTIDVNVKAQKTPVILIGDEKMRLTLKNIYAQWEGNEPVIYGDKMLSPDLIRSISTLAPYVTDKLTVYKKDIWNEAMTFLGLNNTNTEKRERLIVDEANANDQLIEQSARVMLLTRQDAARRINEMFGLSVTVDIRNKPEPIEDEEGGEDEDGTVHSGTEDAD